MANKRFWLGILVLTLVFGITVVGCDNGDDSNNGNGNGNGGGGSGNSNPKSITITGITGKTGEAFIFLHSYLDGSASGYVAGNQGTISNNSLTVTLQKADGSGAWTGSGSYHILIQFGVFDIDVDDPFPVYAYTNGQTITDIGITSFNDFYTKLPKFNVTGSSYTIEFNKFIRYWILE